jgi:hypothetical protein
MTKEDKEVTVMKSALNISRRVVTVLLVMLLMLGTCLFTYACYAVDECEQIDSYYPQQTEQSAEQGA